MHAAAQPLTLLQSRLYLALARNASAGAEDPLLDAAASELETLCSLFRLLQQLLHLESAPAKISATPLADLAAALVEDAEVVFAGSETRLRVQLFMPVASGRAALPQTKEIADVAAMPCLQVDAARTRTALSQILAAARECVAGADLLCQVRQSLLEVELLIEAEAVAVDGSAEPWQLGASTPGGKVEPAHDQGVSASALKPPSEHGQLLIASARVGLTSQGVALEFAAVPFRARVLLPIVTPETESGAPEKARASTTIAVPETGSAGNRK